MEARLWAYQQLKARPDNEIDHRSRQMLELFLFPQDDNKG